MTPVVLGWRLYEVTGNKLSIGFLSLAEVIPAILLALPAGVRVDKSNKHRLLSFCIAAYFTIMLTMLFVVSGWIHIPNNNIQYVIYGLIFMTGVVRAYSGPGFNSFLAQLIPTEKIIKAVPINSMTWLIATVVGSTAGGLIMGYTSITVSFIVVCSLIAIAFCTFQFIKPKPISWQPGNSKTWGAVKEGLQFVFNNKAVLGAFSLDMFAVLFGGTKAILPVYAADILHIGPQGLGWLNAAIYIGNFIAIGLLTSRPIKKRQGRTLLQVVAGFGICILVFAVSKNYWLSFAALFIAGLFDGVSVIIRGTIVQLFVPDNMRGRVSAVNSIFINSSNELGGFESSAAATLMGTIPSVLFGGSMTLLVVIVTWLKAPTLRKFEY